MKYYYRRSDALIQVLLLGVWLYLILTKNQLAFHFYFVVGTWFLATLFAHIAISTARFKSTYKGFAVILGVFISLTVISFLWKFAEFSLLLLLLISPVLAVAFTYTCIAEIIYLHKRPISYIK